MTSLPANSALDRLTALLMEPPANRWVTLEIQGPADGRALLAAAATRVRHRGFPLRKLELDLEGYEDGPDALHHLLETLRLQEGDRADRLAALQPLAARLAPSNAAAAALVLLASCEIAPPLDVTDGPGLLDRVLADLGREGTTWVHARASELTAPLAARLRAAAGRTERLGLVVDVEPGEPVSLWAEPEDAVEPIPCPPSAPQPLSPLAELFDRVEPQLARPLERFLDAAALVGAAVPADTLQRWLGVPEETAERLIDLLDSELTGPESLFWDFQYAHPGLPGEPVYRFTRPAARQAIADRLAPAAREALARELLTALGRNIPATTRTWTRLFAHLAREAGAHGEAQARTRELAWWIGPDEAEELGRTLARAQERGSLPLTAVLDTATVTEGRWPPGRRLAVLEAVAVAAARGTAQEQAGFWSLRTRFLAELGRVPEALEAGRRSLEVAESMDGPNTATAGGAAFALGRLLAHGGNLPEALPLFQRARAVLVPLLGERHLHVAAIESALGATHRDLGDPATARGHLEAALAIQREALGPDHPVVAAAYNDLALALSALGLKLEARDAQVRAVDIQRHALPPGHPQLALALNNLASTLQELGQPAEARGLLEEAVAILTRAHGGHHPAVAITRGNLASCLNQLGERAEAQAALAGALEAAAASLGPDHPLTARLRAESERQPAS